MRYIFHLILKQYVLHKLLKPQFTFLISIIQYSFSESEKNINYYLKNGLFLENDTQSHFKLMRFFDEKFRQKKLNLV